MEKRQRQTPTSHTRAKSSALSQQVTTGYQQTDVHESITKQDRKNINLPQKKHFFFMVSDMFTIIFYIVSSGFHLVTNTLLLSSSCTTFKGSKGTKFISRLFLTIKLPSWSNFPNTSYHWHSNILYHPYSYLLCPLNIIFPFTSWLFYNIIFTNTVCLAHHFTISGCFFL